MSARRLPPVLLAVPFLVLIVLLDGLQHGLTTFHSTDEAAYHLPTIRLFADALPGLHLGTYPAAQTPLFHLLMAVPTWILGLHVWLLRALNVLVAYLAALVLYRLARRRLGLAPWPALAVAGLFELSPYVFGASFLVLTDSLGWLLALLALDRLLGLRDLRDHAVACAWIALALLTRQSYAWLLGVAVVAVWRSLPRGEWAPALGLEVAAAAPLAVLVAVWGGLVPPGSDPASCALCGAGRIGQTGSLTLRPAEFTLAVAAIYAAGLFGPALLAGRERLAWGPVALGAGVGALALVISPLAPQVHDAGYLWQVSGHGPELLGSAWVFWVLVPAGGAAVAQRWRRPGRGDGVAIAMLALFLASTVATRLVYQKYVDPFALVGLILTLRPGELRRPADLGGIAVLAAASVAYALTF